MLVEVEVLVNAFWYILSEVCLRYGVFPCLLGVFCQECVQDVVLMKFTLTSSSYVCTVVLFLY